MLAFFATWTSHGLIPLSVGEQWIPKVPFQMLCLVS